MPTFASSNALRIRFNPRRSISPSVTRSSSESDRLVAHDLRAFVVQQKEIWNVVFAQRLSLFIAAIASASNARNRAEYRTAPVESIL